MGSECPHLGPSLESLWVSLSAYQVFVQPGSSHPVPARSSCVLRECSVPPFLPEPASGQTSIVVALPGQLWHSFCTPRQGDPRDASGLSARSGQVLVVGSNAGGPVAMGSSRSAARRQLWDSLLLGQQLADSQSGHRAMDCGVSYVGCRKEGG